MATLKAPEYLPPSPGSPLPVATPGPSRRSTPKDKATTSTSSPKASTRTTPPSLHVIPSDPAASSTFIASLGLVTSHYPLRPNPHRLLDGVASFYDRAHVVHSLAMHEAQSQGQGQTQSQSTHTAYVSLLSYGVVCCTIPLLPNSDHRTPPLLLVSRLALKRTALAHLRAFLRHVNLHAEASLSRAALIEELRVR